MWLTLTRFFCSVLVRDPAADLRGRRSVNGYLALSGASRFGLRSCFWRRRHNLRLHVGHKSKGIDAHIIGLVIGLRITPVSRFDIL